MAKDLTFMETFEELDQLHTLTEAYKKITLHYDELPVEYVSWEVKDTELSPNSKKEKIKAQEAEWEDEDDWVAYEDGELEYTEVEYDYKVDADDVAETVWELLPKLVKGKLLVQFKFDDMEAIEYVEKQLKQFLGKYPKIKEKVLDYYEEDAAEEWENKYAETYGKNLVKKNKPEPKQAVEKKPEEKPQEQPKKEQPKEVVDNKEETTEE